MIKLQTTDGILLSKIIREVSPTRYESNKQVNKLLDGSYHIQIIGEPLKRKEAEIISSHIQAEKLNELIDKGSSLVLCLLDKTYIVYVDEPISWKRINFGHGNKDKSYYEGQILMIIKEEVLV